MELPGKRPSYYQNRVEMISGQGAELEAVISQVNVFKSISVA